MTIDIGEVITQSGVADALDCPYPSPTECPELLAWLDGVLPIARG